jgi:hypothetical protein
MYYALYTDSIYTKSLSFKLSFFNCSNSILLYLPWFFILGNTSDVNFFLLLLSWMIKLKDIILIHL